MAAAGQRPMLRRDRCVMFAHDPERTCKPAQRPVPELTLSHFQSASRTPTIACPEPQRGAMRDSSVLKALAINPGGLKWTSFDQLTGYFAQNAYLYLYQFVFWLVLFGGTAAIMGVSLTQFVPAFAILYVLSVIMFAIAGWAKAAQFNLEAPLVALVLGLVIANVVRLPQ